MTTSELRISMHSLKREVKTSVFEESRHHCCFREFKGIIKIVVLFFDNVQIYFHIIFVHYCCVSTISFIIKNNTKDA